MHDQKVSVDIVNARKCNAINLFSRSAFPSNGQGQPESDVSIQPRYSLVTWIYCLTLNITQSFQSEKQAFYIFTSEWKDAVSGLGVGDGH